MCGNTAGPCGCTVAEWGRKLLCERPAGNTRGIGKWKSTGDVFTWGMDMGWASTGCGVWARQEEGGGRWADYYVGKGGGGAGGRVTQWGVYCSGLRGRGWEHAGKPAGKPPVRQGRGAEGGPMILRLGLSARPCIGTGRAVRGHPEWWHGLG